MNIVEDYLKYTLYDDNFILAQITNETDHDVWSNKYFKQIFACYKEPEIEYGIKYLKILDPHHRFYNGDCFIQISGDATAGKIIANNSLIRPMNWNEYIEIRG